jgi:hypothetical protein
MTTKDAVLALAAAGLLAFGAVTPLYAEDPPPAGEGATMEVPADPDSAEAGDVAPDADAEGGAGDTGAVEGEGTGPEGGAEGTGVEPPQ